MSPQHKISSIYQLPTQLTFAPLLLLLICLSISEFAETNKDSMQSSTFSAMHTNDKRNKNNISWTTFSIRYSNTADQQET
jgi:hypothetical protein